jgi:AraC-like DNA-binding protein
MKRYSISNIVKLPHYDQVAIFNEQVAVVSTNLFGIDTSQYLFSIDAFVIGYILDGHSVMEINNISYDLDPGCIFILTPTHTCRLQKHNPDFKVRLLLLNSNEYNLSVHLSYIVKSEHWMKTYFNPVIKLTDQEADTINRCTDRIVEQINRKECPNRMEFMKLAVTWHHMELDNILQERVNEINDNNKPLTRQQHLARKLYSLVVNNYRKEHQVKFYSEQMCLTPQYLNQITTHTFGKTLSAIITDQLFTTARSMILSSDMSLQEIANELNFPDQASFSKFIKKAAGVSPNTLRKNNPHKDSI